MNKQARALQDHIKRGNTFYPPFTFDGDESRFTHVDWRADIVPELIWLGLLIQKFGFDDALDAACTVAFHADQVKLYGNRPNFGTVSGYGELSAQEKAQLRRRLGKTDLLENLNVALSPLFRLYPRCPLKFLLGNAKPYARKKDAVSVLAPILEECLFRQEKLPTLVQGIYYEALVSSGKLKFVAPVKKHETSPLKDYPDTEESQMVAGFMRCCATSLPMEGQLPGAEARTIWWPKYFWQMGLKIGPCDPHRPDDVYPSSLPQSFLMFQMDCFQAYNEACISLWESIHETYPYDLHWPLKDEILLGLASRIYRLTVHIVSFPPNWTDDMGQVFLRMIVESYIYYEWLKSRRPGRS